MMDNHLLSINLKRKRTIVRLPTFSDTVMPSFLNKRWIRRYPYISLLAKKDFLFSSEALKLFDLMIL